MRSGRRGRRIRSGGCRDSTDSDYTRGSRRRILQSRSRMSDTRISGSARARRDAQLRKRCSWRYVGTGIGHV